MRLVLGLLGFAGVTGLLELVGVAVVTLAFAGIATVYHIACVIYRVFRKVEQPIALHHRKASNTPWNSYTHQVPFQK